MAWDNVTWDEFEAILVEYRDKEYLSKSGERYYIEVLGKVANLPVLAKAQHVQPIVLFLNRWNCMFLQPSSAQVVLAAWMGEEAKALEQLGSLSIDNPAVLLRQAEFDRLHESLIRLKKGHSGGNIPQMGAACASKILHLMIPSLFVMWDNPIKKHYGVSYGAYMTRMHKFGRRLWEELAPEEAKGDLEAYLQHRLDYPVRKSLAKYIDEYHWSLAWPKP